MIDADPSAVAVSLFDAMKRKRWRRVARLMHPELRETLRQTVLARIENDPTPAILQHMTVETFRKHDPEMPLEVAEYQAQRARDMASRNPWYRQAFGVDDPEALRKLDALTLTALAVEGNDRTVRAARVRDACGPGGCAPGADSKPITTRRTVIGHVIESDDTAHVVFRIRWFQGRKERTTPVNPPRLVMLGAAPEGWRVTSPEMLAGGMMVLMGGPPIERPVARASR